MNLADYAKHAFFDGTDSLIRTVFGSPISFCRCCVPQLVRFLLELADLLHQLQTTVRRTSLTATRTRASIHKMICCSLTRFVAGYLGIWRRKFISAILLIRECMDKVLDLAFKLLKLF